jgi:AraC family transcriptional regulator of adaptative response / DNA-3-methyladenine glycosylase II
MLDYFGLRAIAGVEHVAGGAYRRTILVDGAPGTVAVTRDDPDHLAVDVQPPDAAAATHTPGTRERVLRIFGLDADLEAASAHLAADPALGPLVRAHPGLRVPGTWEPFETGVRAIVGQQVTVAGASTLTARLVARHGAPLPAALAVGGLTHTFPPPDALAEADLDGLGFTAARMQAIRGFAAAVADGRVRLARDAGLDELEASITALPGLGPWTAHYVALRLGEPDAFPASDLGLRRGLARQVGDGTGPVPSAAELTWRAEAWRPWRALAAVLLWSTPG